MVRLVTWQRPRCWMTTRTKAHRSESSRSDVILYASVPFDTAFTRLEEIIARRVHPELYFSSSILDECRDADVKCLGRALSHAGISYTFHAPYIDLVPGGLDRKMREATKERLEHVVHLASLITPQSIVCHPGYDDWRYGEFQDVWLQGSAEMWGGLGKRARKAGVTLLLENVFENAPATLERLLASLDPACFGFCFDVGHWLVYSTAAVDEWMDRLGNRLREIHLHDNHGHGDEHLPPGDGGMFDFRSFFQLLGDRRHHVRFTLEIRDERKLERSYVQVRRYLEP